MEQHPNSRIVHLKRLVSFVEAAQGVHVKDFITSSIKSIGGYFESKTSTKPGSGLNLLEEKILLPSILLVEPGDRDYFKERNKFYQNFETKIPHEGLALEIGLTEDNNKPISQTNLPLNLDDYLHYRHAIKHPYVAESMETARGNKLYQFYLDDPITATNSASSAADVSDSAMQFYLGVKDNPDKINMILTLAGIDFRDVVGQTDAQTVQLRRERVRKIVDDDPKKIVDMEKDKNFEVKYNLQVMVNVGVLRKIGSKYIVAETEKSLGTEEEAILFFKDEEANSMEIALLKSKLQEGLKAKRKAKVVREVANGR